MVRKSSSEAANSRVRASTLSNSRTFSIAIAAWSAKVVTNSICLSTERDALAQHRNGKHGAVITQSLTFNQGVFRISLYIGDMNHPFFQ